MIDFRDIKKEWMRNPEFVREYDALAPEFAVAGQLIRARTQAGMTQAQVAEKNAGHTIAHCKDGRRDQRVCRGAAPLRRSYGHKAYHLS